MDWLRFLPSIFSAIGIFSGGRAEAAALRRQAAVARQQALADEEAQRRESRQFLGRQAAAMAEAGGGIDEGVARQSAVLAELDALNIRYAGQLKASGLLADARAVKKQAAWMAGAQLLESASNAYTIGRIIGG